MGIYTERTGSTREDLAHKIALLISDEEPSRNEWLCLDTGS